MTFRFLVFFLLIFYSPAVAIERADLVLVEKSKHLLTLSKAGKPLASFHVVFGANPIGHKQQEGDEKTPEGRYILDSKKANSAFYKAIHISYPNAQDSATAKAKGVSPGGYIMIHGQKNGFGWLSVVLQRFNWTNGCIALNNSDMDQVWASVDVGTVIEVKP